MYSKGLSPVRGWSSVLSAAHTAKEAALNNVKQKTLIWCFMDIDGAGRASWLDNQETEEWWESVAFERMIFKLWLVRMIALTVSTDHCKNNAITLRRKNALAH